MLSRRAGGIAFCAFARSCGACRPGSRNLPGYPAACLRQRTVARGWRSSHRATG